MARILLIDDNEALRRALAFSLGRAGHEVETASDGEAGCALFKRHACDLVVTDMLMPGQEGISTIRELRALHPPVKIIAISGGMVGDFDPLPAAEKLGADLTLRKPIRNADLLDAVSALLR